MMQFLCSTILKRVISADKPPHLEKKVWTLIGQRYGFTPGSIRLSIHCSVARIIFVLIESAMFAQYKNKMECDRLLGLLFSLLSFVAFSLCSLSTHRKGDLPFKKNTVVLGRNVSCSPEFQKGLFPFKTYTCADIRVGGARLAYGYYDGMGVSETCQETGGKHEFAELCRRMLYQMEGNVPLEAVYIPEASCDTLLEPRVVLTRTKNGYEWRDMGHGNGYVLKLQCSIKNSAHS